MDATDSIPATRFDSLTSAYPAGDAGFEDSEGRTESADSTLPSTPHGDEPRHGHAPAWLYVAALLVLVGVLLDATADAARAHPSVAPCRVLHSADRRACIVRVVFGSEGRKAVRVAWCESRLDPRARNGQYRGVFQMGAAERARFGHGRSVLAQARAAKAYHDLAGWSPWTCSGMVR